MITKNKFEQYVKSIGGAKNLSFDLGFKAIYAKASSFDCFGLDAKLAKQDEARKEFDSMDDNFEVVKMMSSFLTK